ncbi:MAG: helix-turn-helix transcriptional regulator [Flavobacteriaceae bacterium]|nr:helix-turn-helix transcriptional regulator [Flavobacteriaceae bacterium]
MKFIGYKLYKSRKELGLTQGELADKIGCYTADISDWERGKVKPRKSTVKKLASVLNKAMDYFTDENEQKAELDIRAEAQKDLDEAIAQYHDCLDLILTKGADEQKEVAIGMVLVESDEVRKREGGNFLQTSPVLGGEEDETFAQYHKCLDLILTKGTTKQRKIALGVLVVVSEKIRKREGNLSSENKTEKD